MSGLKTIRPTYLFEIYFLSSLWPYFIFLNWVSSKPENNSPNGYFTEKGILCHDSCIMLRSKSAEVSIASDGHNYTIHTWVWFNRT